LILFGKKKIKNKIYKEIILKVVENRYKNIFLCDTSKTLCGKIISKCLFHKV